MLVVLVLLAALAGCAAQPFEVPVISTSGDLPARGESGGSMTLADLLAIPQTPLPCTRRGIVATSARLRSRPGGELTYQGQALLGIVQDLRLSIPPRLIPGP